MSQGGLPGSRLLGRQAVILGALVGLGTGSPLCLPLLQCLQDWGGGGVGVPGDGESGAVQQPFPGELPTEAIISGTSSQACKEGGLISKCLPCTTSTFLPSGSRHLPLPPPSSPRRRGTTDLAGDKAAGAQGDRKEMCAGQPVCTYTAHTHTHTHTHAHVHTKHLDTLVTSARGPSDVCT